MALEGKESALRNYSSTRQELIIFKRQQINTAVMLALGSTATQVVAQDAPQSEGTAQLQRIEITGSSIRQLAGESALPVQTLSAADIAKTGFTTPVTDLIQNLPSMQGFTTNSQSANASGYGVSSASMHGLVHIPTRPEHQV